MKEIELVNIKISFHEMKGDRDEKSAKSKKLPSAVDHNIPVPTYIIFHASIT